MKLSVQDWAFWSPVTCDPLRWVKGGAERAVSLAPRDIPADHIPAMHRRRMSAVSRMGVEIALKLREERKIDYIVFSSRHGEVERSEALIDSIVEGRQLSPTDFSLSVHNTGAGLYSIITGQHTASTSIASGASSFVSAWVEADAYLAENPSAIVQIVNHDSVLPAKYAEYTRLGSGPFALSILLTVAGDDAGVSLRLHGETDADDDEEALGPAFLAWFAGGGGELSVTAERQSFEWSR